MVLTAALDSPAQQHAHAVDDAGGGGAVDAAAQRQQETSLNTNEQSSEAQTTHFLMLPKITSHLSSSPGRSSSGSPTASRPALN